MHRAALFTLALSLLLTCEINQAQSPERSEGISLGFGIDVKSLVNTVYTYHSPHTLQAPAMVFTFDLFGRCRIEPELGFTRKLGYDLHSRLEEKNIFYHSGIGVQYLFSGGNFRPYGGIRYFHQKEIFWYEQRVGQATERITRYHYYGPLAGVSYDFNRRLNLSGDLSYLGHLQKIAYVSRDTGPERLGRGSSLHASLRVRFFFR